MYCPNCGQQQVSDEMRFCSRCGLALSELTEWLAGGRLPLIRREEAPPPAAMSPRRKGMRRAGKLMFFSAALFPVFLLFSAAIEEPGPVLVPFMLFFVSLAMMLYARLFSDTTAPEVGHIASPQTSALRPTPARASLPPGGQIPMPSRHVRTNELAQPPSVTENTTRLLDDE